MKPILLGAIFIALSVTYMFIEQDATPAVMFVPLGLFCIVGGFKYGNRFLD